MRLATLVQHQLLQLSVGRGQSPLGYRSVLIRLEYALQLMTGPKKAVSALQIIGSCNSLIIRFGFIELHTSFPQDNANITSRINLLFNVLRMQSAHNRLLTGRHWY